SAEPARYRRPENEEPKGIEPDMDPVAMQEGISDEAPPVRGKRDRNKVHPVPIEISLEQHSQAMSREQEENGADHYRGGVEDPLAGIGWRGDVLKSLSHQRCHSPSD